MNLSRALSSISADLLNKNVSHLLLDEATAELIHWQTTQIHVDILPLISNRPEKLKVEILEEILSQREYPDTSTDGTAVLLLSSPLLQTTVMQLKSFVVDKFSTSLIICQDTAVYQQMREILKNTSAELYQINCSNIKVAQDVHLIPAYSTQTALPCDTYYWGTGEGGGRRDQTNLSISYTLELQVRIEIPFSYWPL